MGFLASGKANLLPKEFADKGWRKALILAIFDIGCFAVAIAMLIILRDTALQYVIGILGTLVPLNLWYFGYNVKQLKKDKAFVERILSYLEDDPPTKGEKYEDE